MLNDPRAHKLRQLVFEPIKALLSLSDAVADRSGISRYEISQGHPQQPIKVTDALLRKASSRVTFTTSDLAANGIDRNALAPFIFQVSAAVDIFEETIGNSSLERRPVIATGGSGVILALPTAVSASIRRFILETADELGISEALIQAYDELHLRIIREALQIGWNVSELSYPAKDTHASFSVLRGVFDIGAYAQIFYVPDSISDTISEGLQSFHDLPESIYRAVASGIDDLIGGPGFRHGLTIVVHGGFGRGFTASLPRPKPNWAIIGLSIGDLTLLSQDHDFSAIRAWKLLRQENEYAEYGLEIYNQNGFINLYACASQNDFKFVPDEASSGLVYLATNFVAGFRERARRQHDRHAVPSWEDRSWYEVERRRPTSFFKDDENRPIYVCTREVGRGRLLGCVETSARTIWVVYRDSFSRPSVSRFLPFQVWDMALEWLQRLAPVLEVAIPNLPKVFLLTRMAQPISAACMAWARCGRWPMPGVAA